MPEIEGVIKYTLQYRRTEAFHYAEAGLLTAWRSILWQLQLIGQDADRYQGLAYGNMSFRAEESDHFIITGSQTGDQTLLSEDHLCKIIEADIRHNRILAEGPVPPSSEALTHASFYQASRNVRAVVHVHSPEIWHSHDRLALPTINASIQYGTQAMAEGVMALLELRALTQIPLLVMLGHQDGVIAYGETLAEASMIIIRTLALAVEAGHYTRCG